MPKFLKNKIDPYIIDVIGCLRSAGFETYLVGGAVRDILLDRVPKDYDVSTAATPEEVRRVFRDRHTLIIGKRFRLVHLIRGRDITEISTFRKRPEQEEQADRPKRCENAPENMISVMSRPRMRWTRRNRRPMMSVWRSRKTLRTSSGVAEVETS